jgi:hypothetical protein
MGFEVDFGHKQAADLIPSNKFDEKQVGYQALTVLLNEVCSIVEQPNCFQCLLQESWNLIWSDKCIPQRW